MGLFSKFGAAKRATPQSRDSGADSRHQEALRLIDEGNAIEQEGRRAEALQRYDTAVRLSPDLARGHLNRGNVLLDMGDTDGAIDAYATALVKEPRYAAAHYNMGNAHARFGRPEAAVVAYRSAISLNPDFVDAEVALGAALEDLGQLDDAVSSYRRALVLKPDYAEVHSNLGNTLTKLGRMDEAIASYRRVVALSPHRADAYNILGRMLQAQGRPDDAVVNFRRAAEIDPNYADAHCNLGNVLHEIGRQDEAVACYRRALEIRPDSAELLSNLGNALRQLGRFDEAVRSLHRAREIKPGIAAIHLNLGNVLLDIGKLHGAAKSFRRSLEIDPAHADAHCNLGNALYGLGLLNDALACYRRAIEVEANHVLAHANLGNTLSAIGRADQAVASYREALRLDPDYATAQSNLLFSLNYRTDQDGAAMLAEARRYGDVVARKARPFTAWPNVPDPTRRLRVGFVSGDLRNHAVGYFTEGVLAALASKAADRMELFGYPTHFVNDAFTQRIKTSCRGWHPAVHLSDEAFAQRIRDDRIDILIDLSGHTEHNRLSMFAWKPSPVQATWLGYFATTGVATIDYFIADPLTLPESEEAHFTEAIWRLPDTRLCFSKPDVEAEVGSLPALGNGYVTFGSFNRLAKMNGDVVAQWARVLAAVANSRLLLKSASFNERSAQLDVVGRFAAHGIPSERLTLEGSDSLAGFLAAYHRVDVSLDPYPYTGGATSVHSLWMGVPVLTLAGETFVSRQGLGLLMNAGLPDWVATSPEEYVARAIAHTSDLHRLASLRQGLRSQVLSSPIFDTARFAEHFATALEGMWRRWCGRQPAAAHSPM
jgi:predicted O-linked N-acetylglucosamine transferase (SPINDLY family)